MKELLGDYWHEIKEDVIDLYRSFEVLGKNRKSKKSNSDPDPDPDPEQEPSILDILPYVKFNPKYSVFENKTTQGFILRVSHFTGINEHTKNSLRSLLANDIPANCTVQIINYASPRIGNILDYWYNSGSKGEIYKKITEKRRDFFKSGSWQSILGDRQNLLVRDFELYFCFSMPTPMTESGQQSNLYLLRSLQDKITESLKAIGSGSYILGELEFASFLQEILTPSRDMYKQVYEQSKDREKSNINDHFKSENYIEMLKSKLLIGEFQYITYEVTNFPDAWDLESSINYVGQFDSTSSRGNQMPCPFYISYGFCLKGREDSERIADKYRMIKTQQGDSKLPMFFPKMIEEINDWRYVSERINQGEVLGKVVMYIVLIAISNEQAEKSDAILRSHFARQKFKIEKVKYDTANSFMTTLPFNIAENWQILDQLKIPSTMLSGAAMNLMPVFADMQNYKNPLMMFVARRGQLFFFDNFKAADNLNGNFNMVIVGSSGRGKSVWMQEYTIGLLRSGGQVIIIDDGRSFKNTCEILGGDFVDFGGGNFCINPFSLYREPSDIEDNNEYKEFFILPFINLIVSILSIIFDSGKEGKKVVLDTKSRKVLERAVKAVLAKKGSKGGFSDLRHELMNNTIIRSPQVTEICDDFEYILRDYCDDESYAKYFNGKSTLDITNDFTVFEFSDLQQQEVLQNAVLITIVFLTYAKMQGRERRTALIIDEFWKLGKHPLLAEPIEGFARRGRKYNLSLILASQKISDFSADECPAGSVALTQSDWRIMLSVEGKDYKMLREEFDMSAAEIEIANGLSGIEGAYSEFMIRHKSGSWQIGRLLLDPFSVRLYSTKAEDVIAIRKMRAEGISVEEAIERLG